MPRALYGISVLGATAVLAVAGNSSAASSGGTTHNRINECADAGNGYTFCQDLRAHTHSATTPSGDQHVTYKDNFTTTLTGPGGYRETAKGYSHSVVLLKQGEFQISHLLDRREFRYPELTCTVTIKFHFANGDVQVNIDEQECTPTA